MIWDEFLSHFCFRDEEDGGPSDKEQKRKGPKNRPKRTRKRIHQAEKKFFVEIQNSFLILHYIRYETEDIYRTAGALHRHLGGHRAVGVHCAGDAACRAVPQHRSAHGGGHDQLSRRERRDGAEVGNRPPGRGHQRCGKHDLHPLHGLQRGRRHPGHPRSGSRRACRAATGSSLPASRARRARRRTTQVSSSSSAPSSSTSSCAASTRASSCPLPSSWPCPSG